MFLQTAVGVSFIECTAIGSAAGQTRPPKPRIISDFSPPRNNPQGITAVDDTLWLVFINNSNQKNYIISKDGIVQNTFKTPGEFSGDDRLKGITSGNGFVYTIGYTNSIESNVFYQLSKSGNVEQSLALPDSLGIDALAHDGNYLWTTSDGRGLIKQFTTAGNVRQSIQMPKEEFHGGTGGVNGLTYVDSSFWVANINGILKVTQDGEIVSRYRYPRGQLGTSGDVGLTHDGSHLWVARGDINSIAKLDMNVSTPTETPTQTPTQTATESPTQAPRETTGASAPGFGFMSALAGLVGVGYLISSRGSETDDD